MPLVNLDDLVLVGPGSEWFWSMAQFIVVAVTLVGIYYQLRVSRSANAFAHLDAFEAEWVSERLSRARLDALVAIRDGGPDDLLMTAGGAIANFWEKIGSLARSGHIEVRLLRNGSGTHCQTWWGVLGPWVMTLRAEDPDPTIFENFEWLSKAMDAEDRRMGVPFVVTEEWLARTMERRLQMSERAVATHRALRTMILESPPSSAPSPARRRPRAAPVNGNGRDHPGTAA